MVRIRNLGFSTLLLLGCGGESATNDLSLDSGGTGDGSSSAEDGGASDSAEGDTTEGTTDGTTGGGEAIPALGISITKVEANQGVYTPIALNGEWVDGPDRNARLVRDRDTLIRLHHVLEPGWVPRPIEARLDLYMPDATVRTFTQVVDITEDSTERFLDSGFFFGLQAENGDPVPGVQFQVSLWETGAGGEGLTPAVNVAPADAPQQIGFETTDMGIKVVFVPITYEGRTPDLQDPVPQQFLLDHLYEKNPVTWIDATWHAPLPYGGSLSNPGPLLSVMENLHAQEGAASNVYYAAIVDMGPVTGGFVAGIANGIPGLFSANRFVGSWDQLSDTVTHEIGHDQGMRHVYCANASTNAAGADPSYPDPGGFLPGTGFGVRSLQVHSTSLTFDYMTYCGPTFVSDFGWRKAWDRISSFTAQGRAAPPTVDSLRIALYPDGTEEYWTHRVIPRVERTSGNYTVRFEHEGEVIEQPAEFHVLTDDQTIWLTIPLPHEGEIELHDWDVTWIGRDGVHPIDATEIRIPEYPR
jgi:hypothetical protein